MTKCKMRKDDMSEDYCFICKDGGHLRVCDYKNCLKSYHPQCLNKDASFLESNERWTCGCHTCFICQKSSVFQCYCCPNSVCRACIKKAEFVQVKKRTKGFCNDCLSLTILIEEKNDVDSDGRKVDFEDTETYEFLFKDYWEIIKDQEGLTLIDLQAANALLKRGEHCKSGSESAEEAEMSEEYNDLDDICDGEISFLKDLKGKPNIMKAPKSRGGPKKKTFIGWGSVELINFLASIGKDTKEPLSQLDACETIKHYIRANNLYLSDNKKRKNVICDERLHSLFRKRKVKLHKIYNLLECHFAENDHSDDEFSFSSEEGDSLSGRRKKQRINSGLKVIKALDSYAEPPKSVYASIVAQNINAVYLKKSLVIDLLKSPLSFENKVISCFVRVKNDPKESFCMNQKMHQLGQVTGVKKAPLAYKIGDVSTDIVLCVPNIPKDVQISLLSDEDFEEEECEDLRQLVKNGLLRKLTVAEMEEKIRNIHEDITNHRIDRELKKLQKLIDKANEKGWRRELYEYIERRELLSSLEGRQDLLKKIPPVIADALEVETAANILQSSDGECKGNEVTSLENKAEETYEGNGSESHDNAAEEGLEGVGVTTKDALLGSQVVTGDVDMAHESFLREPEGGYAAKLDPLQLENEGGDADLLQQDNGGTAPTSSAAGQLEIETPPQKFNEVSPISTKLAVSIKEEKEVTCSKQTSEIQVIDLLEDDDKVWHYLDPSGNQQGPFDMNQLMRWNRGGYFYADFKVWRTGQSIDDAIPLADAMRLCE